MKTISLIVVLAMSFTANAEVLTYLKLCSKISDSTERLDCFDSVVTHYNKHKQSISSSPVINDSTINNSANPNITQPNNMAITNSEVINITKEDAFGKSTAELSDLESIKSNIIGEFKGWKKDEVITLKNGQQWKVTSNNSGYVNLKDPEVEITKGFWGSFNMKVTGLNAQGKVRRIN